jgi:hypothetical protein
MECGTKSDHHVGPLSLLVDRLFPSEDFPNIRDPPFEMPASQQLAPPKWRLSVAAELLQDRGLWGAFDRSINW